MCVITEDSVERLFVPGDELPRFWEGKEVLPTQTKKALVTSFSGTQVVPIDVET